MQYLPRYPPSKTLCWQIHIVGLLQNLTELGNTFGSSNRMNPWEGITDPDTLLADSRTFER